jgi:hypothetical protein
MAALAQAGHCWLRNILYKERLELHFTQQEVPSLSARIAMELCQLRVPPQYAAGANQSLPLGVRVRLLRCDMLQTRFLCFAIRYPLHRTACAYKHLAPSLV